MMLFNNSSSTLDLEDEIRESIATQRIKKRTILNFKKGLGQEATHQQLNAQLSDFEIISVLGKGAFGKVYLVRRNGTENYYAMKKLKKEVVAKRNLMIKT